MLADKKYLGTSTMEYYSLFPLLIEDIFKRISSKMIHLDTHKFQDFFW